MRNIISLLAVAILLLGALFMGCGKSPSAFELDPDGYGKTTLDNGVMVLVNFDDSTPLTSCRILIPGGVLTESVDNNGITNLMTRMLLKGNDKLNADEIIERLDYLGVNIAVNCFRDYSTISFTVLSEYLGEVLTIISNSLASPTFPEEELVRLKEEIEGEIKSSDDSQSAASSKLFWKTAYGDKGYGLPVLGTAESLAGITVADLKEHYNMYVGGANIIFSVSSDQAPANLMPMVERSIGQIKAKADPIPTPDLQLQTEHTGFINYDRNQSYVFTGVVLKHPDPIEVAYLRLLDEVMGNNVGSRLWFLRQKEKLAYSVYTQYLIDKHDAVFRAAIGTDTSKVKQALGSLKREWKSMVENGITAEELTDAKTNMKNNLIYSMDKKANRANNMAYYEYVGYNMRFVLDLIEMADKVALEDINGFLADQFTEDKKFTSVVGKL